ncbi:hypothetical protein A2U01_0058640, partial [Trifolium medium]|nr:hypothetical protein [Trifolium medium]
MLELGPSSKPGGVRCGGSWWSAGAFGVLALVV